MYKGVIMLYVIYYDDDTGLFGYFKDYSSVVNFAENYKSGLHFTIYEYDIEEDKLIER